jgi:hypothetical protein
MQQQVGKNRYSGFKCIYPLLLTVITYNVVIVSAETLYSAGYTRSQSVLTNPDPNPDHAGWQDEGSNVSRGGNCEAISDGAE